MGGEVQQCLGQDAGLLEALDEDVPLPLGQLAAVPVQEQRQVGEGRRAPAQGAVQQQVLGGGDEPLGAPQHVADAHEVVVHHVGQVVGGEAVRLHDHGVALHLQGGGGGARGRGGGGGGGPGREKEGMERKEEEPEMRGLNRH